MITFRIGLVLFLIGLQFISVLLYAYYPMPIIGIGFTSRQQSPFESFQLKREREKGKDIPIGILPNTPGPLKGVMRDMNIVGMQVDADSEFDVVDTKVLEKAR